MNKSILVADIINTCLTSPGKFPLIAIDFPENPESSGFDQVMDFLENRDVCFNKKSSSKKSWMTNQTFE